MSYPVYIETANLQVITIISFNGDRLTTLTSKVLKVPFYLFSTLNPKLIDFCFWFRDVQSHHWLQSCFVCRTQSMILYLEMDLVHSSDSHELDKTWVHVSQNKCL